MGKATEGILEFGLLNLRAKRNCRAGSQGSVRGGGNMAEKRVQRTALRQGSTEDQRNCSCRYWGEAQGEEVNATNPQQTRFHCNSAHGRT